MKKMLVTIVLVFAAMVANQESAQSQAQPAAPQQPAGQQPAAAGQPAAQPGQSAAPAGQSSAQPQQKKEIKDPAEYNAYVGAVQQTDPNAKISGLEAFLQQYPNSVMKEDALELLMVSYSQTNNAAKMADAAQRVLQVNPKNVRALTLLANNAKTQGQWADAEKYAAQGVTAVPNMTTSTPGRRGKCMVIGAVYWLTMARVVDLALQNNPATRQSWRWERRRWRRRSSEPEKSASPSSR